MKFELFQHEVKITPKHTPDWYVKWVAVAFAVVAVLCRTTPEIPLIYDMAFSIVATMGWFLVGWAWHDRSLMVLNSILTFVLASGILRHVYS